MEADAENPAASHVVLLGEGDLSFARALGLQRFEGRVTATELRKPADVRDDYFGGSDDRLAELCDELLRHGIHVILGVDVKRCECNDVCYHWRTLPSGGTAFVEAPLWDGHDLQVSQFIFNFPHTTCPGRMEKLLRLAFRSMRRCIASGIARPDCAVEMRLRHGPSGWSSAPEEGGLLRSRYCHEEAAADACFELASVGESDLDALAEFGYEQRSTKRNASCGNLDLVKVWRWVAAPISSPSAQRLPEGCRRDVLFVPEKILDRQQQPFVSWKGPSPHGRRHYLVCWRGHPESGEHTWEAARDLALEVRRAYDEAHPCAVG